MLGLSGILHMGSNDKFDRITIIFYLFSIIWNKIESYSLHKGKFHIFSYKISYIITDTLHIYSPIHNPKLY